MHGVEYGSRGICLARSEHGVTAPMGGRAAALSSAASPAPPRPARAVRRGAAGPLGRVVAGAALSGAPDAAWPLAGGAAAPAATPEGAVRAAGSAPTVSCNRSAGTVRALATKKAMARATTG